MAVAAGPKPWQTQTNRVAELLEEGQFAIAHSDHGITLIPRHSLSSPSQISLVRCFYVCLKSVVNYSAVLDKGFFFLVMRLQISAT